MKTNEVKENNRICDYPINICKYAAQYSTDFEESNTNLKRQYLVDNINLYNDVVSETPGYRGSFGTGYPFYALDGNLSGQLPIIDEQLRYNNELIEFTNKSTHVNWDCASCLLKNGDSMPDLKQICNSCPNMDDELKPRKVINRLPDLDMWTVCDERQIEKAKLYLLKAFAQNNMYPSDIDPLRTLKDIKEITEAIKNGTLPDKMLPLDSHIIAYKTLTSLIEQVPGVLEKTKRTGEVPYLPIHPESYRKVWQKDDVPYNYVYDYLSSFTDFNFAPDLKEALTDTRSFIASKFTPDELYNFLLMAGPESARKRFETPQLEKCFKERIKTWKR